MSDFAHKTKNEIMELLKQAALDLYSDKSWSGLQTGSFEWLLANLVAEASDLNGFYLDQRANNAYITDADIRRDMRSIAHNIGLYPRERTGAHTDLTITAATDVTIPLGTSFLSSNGETYVSTVALVLSVAGTLVDDLDVVHSNYTTLTYRTRGDVGERVALNQLNVLDADTTVTVNGVVWTKVDTFSGSDSTSKVYRVSFDERNQAEVLFGDGVRGKRLPADATIVFNIYYGGGPAGNSVGVGEITIMLDSFTGSGNVSVITNTSAPTGGRAADDLATVAASIPAGLASISGIINAIDGAKAIKNNLNWISDAKIEQSFTTINSTYVPKATVYAYPSASTITGMSAAQSTALASLLTDSGELGVSWATSDAYGAPVELELEVHLDNPNLENQKTAEIKAALVDNDDALFAFENLGFDVAVTKRNVLDTVHGVSGVSYVKINKFAKIPQTIVIDGTTGTSIVAGSDAFAADLETTDLAEDGYFQFDATSTSDADVSFFSPVLLDNIGTTFAKSSTANWLVKEFSYATGSELDDTDGPYVKTNGSGKIEFKQLTNVWKNDLYNGSTYLDKYMLRFRWVNDSNVVRTAYYHISDTITPGVITTVEAATSPVSGTAITTLANANYNSITVQIVKDQSKGSTNTLCTPTGQQLTIVNNDSDTLYFSSNPIGIVPSSGVSYIRFNENALDTTVDNWASNSGALYIRCHKSTNLTIGNIIRIYTTPFVADRLLFSAAREVFTLSKTNISVIFV